MTQGDNHAQNFPATDFVTQTFMAELKRVIALLRGWYRTFQPDGNTLSSWAFLLRDLDASLFVPAAEIWAISHTQWPPEASQFRELVEDLERKRENDAARLSNTKLVELSKARSLRNYSPAICEGTTSALHALARSETGGDFPLDVSEQRLFQALRDNELFLVYQPIVDMGSGSICGAEALIRWNHPEFGTVMPEAFVPHLEVTGLIGVVDASMIRQACRQAREWLTANLVGPDFALHVNVSGVELGSDQLEEYLGMILAESGVPPKNLVIEITETALPPRADLSANAAGMRKISDLGVRIALDDFGSGFSSLSRLAEFPVDLLKIDKSFVSQIGNERENIRCENILGSIFDMAHRMGLGVIAEGVETDEQAGLLIQLGCQLGQGFHFGKPMPPADLAASLG
ncbi:MAG: EAL domain-containing protein [Actinomycetota bacterium]|nr:EAL domain-containing protein [Actinomycetota bacterium]